MVVTLLTLYSTALLFWHSEPAFRRNLSGILSEGTEQRSYQPKLLDKWILGYLFRQANTKDLSSVKPYCWIIMKLLGYHRYLSLFASEYQTSCPSKGRQIFPFIKPFTGSVLV